MWRRRRQLRLQVGCGREAQPTVQAQALGGVSDRVRVSYSRTNERLSMVCPLTMQSDGSMASALSNHVQHHQGMLPGLP